MSAVAECVRPWVPLIRLEAPRWNLKPNLVAAVVAQESSGNPWAQRPEPSFYQRYKAGILALVKRTAFKADDYWARYPDIFSSSYGLMQVLLTVAIEHGFTFEFPTELCDPPRNLAIGCKVLRSKINAASGNLRDGLLRWNGGSNKSYPDEVLAKLGEINDSGVFGAGDAFS
ncbi:MAG TPA: lytic transglycosylase domain-containing protein [Candidatus Binatia bacterium]|nr:lytic transglycosylase domain-containing protein [Candidatus Binatia bacterium]